jgi:transposase
MRSGNGCVRSCPHRPGSAVSPGATIGGSSTGSSGALGTARPGGPSQASTGLGRPATTGSRCRTRTAPGTRSSTRCNARPMPRATWTGTPKSMRPSSGPASTRPEPERRARSRTKPQAAGAREVPGRKDKAAQARRKRGPRGGQPPKFNAEACKERNHVERGFGRRKQWRGRHPL